MEGFSFIRGLDPKDALGIGIDRAVKDLVEEFTVVGEKYLNLLFKKYSKVDIYIFLKAGYDAYKNQNGSQNEYTKSIFMEEFKIDGKTFWEAFYPGVDLDPDDKKANETWLETEMRAAKYANWHSFYVNGGYFNIRSGIISGSEGSMEKLRKLVSTEWMETYTIDATNPKYL